jgi:hypothetical protein
MSPQTDVGASSPRALMRAANAYFPREMLLVAHSPRLRESRRCMTKQRGVAVTKRAACSDQLTVRAAKCRCD